MVVLYNRDCKIYDFNKRIIDIISEYQSTGEVQITTNLEGLCLESAGLYSVLDYLCEKFKFDKKKIFIETKNAEEYHPEYQITVDSNQWVNRSKEFIRNAPTHKDVEFWVAAFFGKPNWHRLVLSAWMHQNYSDKCLQTMHYNANVETHRAEAGLTEVLVDAPAEIVSVANFLEKCPLTLTGEVFSSTIVEPIHYDILSYYDKFFVELVSETYVTGKSFFPTEKTLRPIMALTPFIVMGPQGYLANLRRVGFKTFGDWWDERYDDLNMYERILAIKEVIETIMILSKDDLNRMLNEMEPVLLHNKNILKSIDGRSIYL